MKEFILTLLGVSIVSGLASMLSPEGKGGGLRSFLGFACGLCALSVTVAPILSFIGMLASDDADVFYESHGALATFDYEKIFEETLTGEGERSLEEGLKSVLSAEFEIARENIDVDVILVNDGEEITAEHATLILRGDAVLKNAHELAERVRELISCECRVIYGGSDDK